MLVAAPSEEHAVPEPLVTYDWCASTGGALTPAQRRRLLARSLAAYADHATGLARLALGRRADGPVVLPTAPDAALTRAAVEVAADQGPELEGHGFRTWLFGGALAERDGAVLDPELFHVAAICHDAGAAQSVAGEDFTIRSADTAVAAFDRADRPLDADRARQVRDGVVAHTTAGVTVDVSTIGTYVQAGAMLDLAGVRLVDLPRATVDEVFARHPAGAVRDRILRVIRDEAAAVPRGRFAQLRRLGLGLAVRTSPSLRGRRTPQVPERAGTAEDT